MFDSIYNIIMLTENEIDNEVYDLLSSFFSKEEIANLTLAIAQINSWTRLARSFKFTPGNYKVSR